jgi:hypothetical protein
MWRWLERARGLTRERDAARLPRVFVYARHIADDVYPRLYLGALSALSTASRGLPSLRNCRVCISSSGTLAIVKSSVWQCDEP